MRNLNDKQNDLAILIDFKKKPKNKPKSSRSFVLEQNADKKDRADLTSAALALLEKKKKYSMAIRQKNLNISQCKKDKYESCGNREDTKITINMDDLRCSSLNTVNILSPVAAQKYNSTILGESAVSKISQSRIESNKSKTKDSKKMRKFTQVISDFRQYGIGKMRAEIVATNRSNIASMSKIPDYGHMSMFTGTNTPAVMLQNKMTLNSQTVNEVAGPFETEEQKEVDVIKRQNNTFKKELAYFRKQNGQLKRDLEDSKKQCEQLKQKYQAVMAESQEQLQFIQNLQFKPTDPITTQNLPQDNPSTSGDSNLKQILSSYEARLFEVDSANKKLQFKNYMLQKRLMDETQTHKKILAREISVWRERYIKAKHENSRLKDSRQLFEMSVSASEEM